MKKRKKVILQLKIKKNKNDKNDKNKRNSIKSKQSKNTKSSNKTNSKKSDKSNKSKKKLKGKEYGYSGYLDKKREKNIIKKEYISMMSVKKKYQKIY